MKWLNRLLDAVEDACALLASLLILYILGAICVDVTGRYLLGLPLGAAIELTATALMAVPFLTMAWLVRTDDHVKIDILLTILPLGVQLCFRISAYCAAIVACGFAAFFALRTTISLASRGVMTFGLFPYPVWLITCLITFGLLLTAFELLRQNVRLVISLYTSVRR